MRLKVAAGMGDPAGENFQNTRVPPLGHFHVCETSFPGPASQALEATDSLKSEFLNLGCELGSEWTLSSAALSHEDTVLATLS